MFQLMGKLIMNVKKIQRCVKDFRVIRKTRMVCLKFHWKRVEQESFTLQSQSIRIRRMMAIMGNEYDKIKQKALE